MVKLPDISDPTLDASDRALEALENGRPVREYLGMSGVGHQCSRKSWYDWRWFSKTKFNAQTLKRFQDGHDGEELQAKRLRMVDGVLLLTIDPETNRQIAYKDMGGHFRGHSDGVIVGLIQSPKTWHIWEHKQVEETKFNSLIKLKTNLGEKNALKEWSEIYYSQACLYMGYSGIERHYLTCSTPGGRKTTSVRTNFDIVIFTKLKNKAERIIQSAEPPERISQDPAWFACRMCDHREACHGASVPERHCRSCLSATPVTSGEDAGKWHCERYGWTLNGKMQRHGCGSGHRYIPSIVPGKQVDAKLGGADGREVEWIEYEMNEGGMIWRDEGAESDH